jgi:hypothetical protein
MRVLLQIPVLCGIALMIWKGSAIMSYLRLQHGPEADFTLFILGIALIFVTRMLVQSHRIRVLEAQARSLGSAGSGPTKSAAV